MVRLEVIVRLSICLKSGLLERSYYSNNYFLKTTTLYNCNIVTYIYITNFYIFTLFVRQQILPIHLLEEW